MMTTTTERNVSGTAAVASVDVRRGVPEDGEVCGRICFEAFRSIAERHGFPPDFPTPEVGIAMWSALVSNPGFYTVVAARDGEVVGSNFLDERSQIAGVGPITVDPAAQDLGVGRHLMEDVLRRATRRGFAGIRLVQAAYHPRSLALYASLGFVVREPLACVQGPAIGEEIPGYTVRLAVQDDVDLCAEVCRAVHGHQRSVELGDAIRAGAATVVEHDGRIVGYSSGVAFFGHSVAETGEGLRALIAAAPAFGGPGILVPMRDGGLLHWCLRHGLRVVHAMNLMTLGLYNEPVGAYLPSVLF
jgi:GNAT superfamily N-acetyltransferase